MRLWGPGEAGEAVPREASQSWRAAATPDPDGWGVPVGTRSLLPKRWQLP